METVRTLAIAGGGQGYPAAGGGGGGGGFMDNPSFELKTFKHYDVVVGGAGQQTYIKEQDLSIETSAETTIFTLFDDWREDVVSLPAFVGTTTKKIWAKLVVSGTRYSDRDGAQVQMDNVSVFGSGTFYDDTFYADVTSLVNGKGQVTIRNRGVNQNCTLKLSFITGYDVLMFAGGVGGGAGVNSDNEGDRGRNGGSGGGGGEPRSPNESGGEGGRTLDEQGFAGTGGDSWSSSNNGDKKSGGGGGAGGAGASSTGNGGVGLASDITGTSIFYAGGGRSDDGSSAGNGSANAGGGGDGGGGTGQDGLVVFRYTRSSTTHPYSGGTITYDGNDVIHTFTSDGTLTPNLPPIGALSLSLK